MRCFEEYTLQKQWSFDGCKSGDVFLPKQAAHREAGMHSWKEEKALATSHLIKECFSSMKPVNTSVFTKPN